MRSEARPDGFEGASKAQQARILAETFAFLQAQR